MLKNSKWRYLLIKSPEGILCWTYNKNVGYVFEGIWLDFAETKVYYRNYVDLLNECFGNDRILNGSLPQNILPNDSPMLLNLGTSTDKK